LETLLQVFSEDEKTQVHERSLKILAETGVKVNTAKGRQYLKDAGAEVDENSKIVKFPRAMVEESLRLAPKDFTLGARRPGWDLSMNAGECTLMIDGEGTSVIDRKTGEHRPSTFDDWLEATCVIDALDEFGVYWDMVERGDLEESISNAVKHWRNIFSSFSKHVQDASPNAEFSLWLVEIIQAIFGDKETVRRTHPFSFIVCPQSPLEIEGRRTDAYLELLGWDIPIAVMPMPLMGGTGPGNMISITMLGNCEILAMLCLIQAADPGTPFIYAPALAVMNPRTGAYNAGAVENGLLSSAGIEMARYYGLPVEGSGGGTDTYAPGIQASYERALNALTPMLSWPDLFVGSGLLGGSMILSLEQLVIDAEVFRMSKQAHRGILTDDDMWLDDVIQRVGPGGDFLGEISTVANMRSGEWLIPSLGVHQSQESWEMAGKKDILEEAREKVENLLSTHKPLPLSDEVEKELDKIQKRANQSSE
jgi:trimethylamine--corrinoid protein Co-methyltransferase|tara:strand:- start:976 stop:2412 length:1437 start_codon:yes stop_codon:yes gene_type:complete